MAYESTTVPVERSQGAIRKLLIGANVQQLAFGEDRDEDARRWAALTFSHRALEVRMRVPLKQVDERAVGQKYSRARSKSRDECRDELYEQEERRIWRVIAWNLKARMVAVDEDVETFEQAFLPHLVNPRTGHTIYEQLAVDGRVELPPALLELPPGAVVDAEVIA